LEIGGADILSYRDLMQLMARERDLPRRVIVPVPMLTPLLSSLRNRAARGAGWTAC
jgi:hypothetical protein